MITTLNSIRSNAIIMVHQVRRLQLEQQHSHETRHPSLVWSSFFSSISIVELPCSERVSVNDPSFQDIDHTISRRTKSYLLQLYHIHDHDLVRMNKDPSTLIHSFSHQKSSRTSGAKSLPSAECFLNLVSIFGFYFPYTNHSIFDALNNYFFV